MRILTVGRYFLGLARRHVSGAVVCKGVVDTVACLDMLGLK